MGLPEMLLFIGMIVLCCWLAGLVFTWKRRCEDAWETNEYLKHINKYLEEDLSRRTAFISQQVIELNAKADDLQTSKQESPPPRHDSE